MQTVVSAVWLALAVTLILVGIAIIVLFAHLALTTFKQWTPQWRPTESLGEAINQLGSNITIILAKLGFLSIGLWGGKILIGYGVDMVKSVRRQSEEGAEQPKRKR